MSQMKFDFLKQNSWDMGPACKNISLNPAPITNPCIYLIHNSTENTTYVGYADGANDRWKTRTEVFHISGITEVYGKGILCAYCLPTANTVWQLKGQNNCEHVLIRAVANGLLGKTTSTNTQLGSTWFMNSASSTLAVQVYLPAYPGKLWGKLESGGKEIKIQANSAY